MSTKAPPRRTATRRRFHAALEQELTRARGRIRAIDCFTTLLVLVVAALGYVALIVLLDGWLRLPDGARQVLLAGLVVGGGVYLFFALIRPLFREVNPYYAARALERSEPESKNALINWLDLRSEPLPPVIRDAVQRQAVEELEHADVEQAIPTRRPMRLFFLLAGLLVVLVGLRLFLPEQFTSLLSRALFPFQPTAVPTSTRFELVSPVQDEVSDDPLTAPVRTIPVEPGLPVNIAAIVHGKVPEAVVVEYQATLDEKPRRKALTPPGDDARRLHWSTNLASDAIPADGLYFRIRGGDGQSRLYHLLPTSKKAPSIADIDVVYHYPRYTNRPPKEQKSGKLSALVGTKVEMTFSTDQPVRSARLDVQAGGRIVRNLSLHVAAAGAERERERVLTLPEPLVLGPELKDQASYYVTLIGKEGKAEVSPPYTIEVEEDQKPQVTIEKIGQEVLQPEQTEVRLAVNDVAQVIGKARDDIAVNLARLRVKAADGRELRLLAGKPQEGPLQKANGYFQPAADYLLILHVDKLTDAPKGDAPPIAFKEGDRLELWVEATDNREPEPNLGESKHITVILTKPLDKEKQEEKQKEAQEQADQREKDRQEKNSKENEKQAPEPGDKNQKREQEKKKSDPMQPDKSEGNENQKPEPGKPDGDKNTKPEPGKPDGDKNAKPEPGKPDGDKNAKPEPGKPDGDKNAKPEPGKPDGDKNAKPEPGKPDGDKSAKPQPGKPDGDKNAKPQPGKPDGDKSAKPQPGKPDGDKNAKPEPGKPDGDKNAKPQPGKPDGDKNAKPQPGKPDDDKNAKPQPGKPDGDKNAKPEPGKPDGDKNAKPEPGKPDGDKNAKPEPGKPDGDKNAKPEPGKPDGDKNTKPEPGKPDGDKNAKPEPGNPDADKNAKPEPRKSDGNEGEKPEPGKKGNGDAQKQADDLNQKADELAKALGQGQGTQPPEKRGETTTPPQKPDAVNPDDARRAKDLLLDTFKKKMERGEIDKDVLKKMNWSEEEARAFLKDYEAAKNSGLLDRQKGTGGRAEAVGRSGTKIDNPLDLKIDPATVPPPELREAYERYVKRQAERKK